MKKKLFLLCTLCSLSFMAWSQTYINPKYGARSLKEVEITKIEITKNFTIVHFYFDSGDSYPYGGWISLSREMYLKDAKTQKRYYLIKSENIPILPERINFEGKYTRRFKAYFPSIDPTTEMIHIIEETSNGFNFYKIRLQPIA